MNSGPVAAEASRLPNPANGSDDSPVAPETAGREIIIRVCNLVVGFGSKLIIQDLALEVYRGEVVGCVGGSGTGKSVLTRTILGLVRKQSGRIEMFGRDVDSLSPREHGAIERRIGVMFQQGALFSGLTVKQNLEVPMREHLQLSPRLSEELAMLKIELAGLRVCPRS